MSLKMDTLDLGPGLLTAGMCNFDHFMKLTDASTHSSIKRLSLEDSSCALRIK